MTGAKRLGTGARAQREGDQRKMKRNRALTSDRKLVYAFCIVNRGESLNRIYKHMS